MTYALRHAYQMMFHGDWHIGFGLDKNWPFIGIQRAFYDGDIIVLHFGPLWIEIHYWGGE